MKLKIRSESKNLTLWLPTFILKMKFLRRFVNDEKTRKFLECMPKVYKELKKYIKSQGHFVLVDVMSSDGEGVQIIV